MRVVRSTARVNHMRELDWSNVSSKTERGVRHIMDRCSFGSPYWALMRDCDYWRLYLKGNPLPCSGPAVELPFSTAGSDGLQTSRTFYSITCRKFSDSPYELSEPNAIVDMREVAETYRTMTSAWFGVDAGWDEYRKTKSQGSHDALKKVAERLSGIVERKHPGAEPDLMLVSLDARDERCARRLFDEIPSLKWIFSFHMDCDERRRSNPYGPELERHAWMCRVSNDPGNSGVAYAVPEKRPVRWSMAPDDDNMAIYLMASTRHAFATGDLELGMMLPWVYA